MLKQRLFFGALLIAALLGLLYADQHLALQAPTMLRHCGLQRLNGIIPTLLLVALVWLGTRELRTLIVTTGYEPLACWPICINVALILMPFFVINGAPKNLAELAAIVDGFIVILLTIALMGCGLFVARRRRTEGAIAAVATSLLIIFYLGLLPSFLIRIRLFAHADAGVILLLYFVATVKLCDIGAYFTGRALGKHKLIEWLSPKKTIEGLLGGIALSTAFAVIFPLLARRCADPASLWPQVLPEPAIAALFGVAMAVVGQMGDLFESLLKRNAQVKDSAQAIPAFGGLLDVLDSLLPTAPLAYWILLK